MEFGLKILVETLVGTMVMTVFSYGLSGLLHKRYREPKLINYLINRNGLQVFHRKEKIAGWIVHFLIGSVFALLCEFIWWQLGIFPDGTTILLFGVLFGLMGVLGWSLMFWLSRKAPRIDKTGFFVHLVVAHIFFIGGIVVVYRMW